MKKLAAHYFEDLLQVCIMLFFIGPTMLTCCQCILPVLDGLLPEPHNSNTLDLVLTSFEQITSELGVLLRRFTRVTCTAFKMTELPRERAACIPRAARNPGPAAAGPKIKTYTFNMNTYWYKVHALGDYPQTICERGTTDNYTTRRASTIYTYLCPTPGH